MVRVGPHRLLRGDRVPHREIERRCAPILAKTSCSFRAPLQFPDTVTVRTSIAAIGSKSFTMRYEIESAALQAIAAEGDGVVVWYDYARGASIALPDDLRERLSAYAR